MLLLHAAVVAFAMLLNIAAAADVVVSVAIEAIFSLVVLIQDNGIEHYSPLSW